MQHVEAVVRAAIDNQAWRATKYVSDKAVVRATQRRYLRRSPRLGSREDAEVSLHIGRPNYAERLFVKKCKRAGEPFPVKKIQLQFPPKRRS